LSRQNSDGRPTYQRLTAEQIAEQTDLITDLLENGYTLEQGRSQFASGMHPDDWQLIQETAVSRSGRNQNQVSSRNAAQAHS
jgi:hypothetical protein